MRHLGMATLTTAALIGTMVVAGGPASASPNKDLFDANNNTWACEDEGPLPDDHCINARSQGRTGVIMVFDERGPQESISLDPMSDSRPCPHDAAAADGTWWAPPGTSGIWVCHHRP